MTDGARRPRPRWPYLSFFLLAAAFGWQLLLQDRILLPTNPATVPPWTGDASAASAAIPSNGLMMDTLIFTLPTRVYNGEMLRAGEIPFWNPHVFAGYPHLALIQNTALYPLSAPFDLIEPLSGMGYSILLHLALAGCLTFAFLRARGLDDGAAFLGGAAFELNGMFLIRLSAPSYVFSGAWLPLMLLGTMRVARTGSLRAGWPLLLATTASVLGGHPQITSLCLTVSGIFLLVETLTTRDATGTRDRLTLLGRVLASFAGLVVLGVAVAGFQVVPFLELMSSSARRSIPLEVYRRASTPFTGLLQALVPDVFGHPVELDYWFQDRSQLVDGIAPRERIWALNFSGQNLYTGLAPLVLACVAVARTSARRRRDVLLFALVTLGSLGVLLGTPLIDAAYVLIPGFRHSRPDRIAFLYMSGLAFLTAYGFAALAPRRDMGDDGDFDTTARDRRSVLLIAASTLLVLLWPIVPRLANVSSRADLASWLGMARGQWAAHLTGLLPQLVGSLLLALACILLARPTIARRIPSAPSLVLWAVLLIVPSVLFGWRFNPMQMRPEIGATALERALVDAGATPTAPVRIARILPGLPQALPANVVQLLGVDDVNGASAAGVGGYLDLIDAAEPGSVNAHKYFRAFRDPAITGTRVLDLLNAGLVLANVELPSYQPLAREDGLTLYRNPNALPRFWLVDTIDRYDDVEDGRKHLLASDFDPATRSFVERDTAVELEPRDAAPAGSPDTRSSGAVPGSVAVVRREPHRIQLRVETPRPALLVSSEVAYPGWETRIDGADAPTVLVNTAFRGTIVPAGAHEVEMVYVPRSFHAGVALSLAGLVVMALVWRPRRKSPPHARI